MADQNRHKGSHDGRLRQFKDIGAVLANLTATSQIGLIMVYPGVTGTTSCANATGMINAALPRTWRINYTIGGTTPSFTFTSVDISCLY